MSETLDARQTPYLLFTLLLSVLTLVVLAIASVEQLDPEIRSVLQYADWMVCTLFFGDFLYQLARAPRRLEYLRRWGWLDLLSCIPIVDSLRWTRVARVARILVLLRALRSARVLWRFLREQRAQSSILVGSLLALAMLVLSAAAVLHFEKSPESNIRSAGDALWWALSTMTTVGYGDVYPVTPGGRITAVALMTVGVGLFATLSGALAAWFLRDRREGGQAELRAEIKALRLALQSQHRSASQPSADHQARTDRTEPESTSRSTCATLAEHAKGAAGPGP